MFPVTGFTSLAAFLTGTWAVERRLTDRRTGKAGHFRGTASFVAAGDGLQYLEEGELSWPPHRGPARRALRYEFPAPWTTAVSFEDGRPFHSVDLAAGKGTGEHLCGADRYRAEYRLTDSDAWEVTWRVTGPAKSLELNATYTTPTRL